MAKIKEMSTLTTVISKAQNYKEHKVLLAGIDKEREDKFNAMQQIEVSTEELNAIGEHRWLIKEK